MRGRSRKRYAILTIFIMVVGLVSRRVGYLLPAFMNMYVGDVLWALMVFFGIAFLVPKLPTYQIWLISLGFCWFIEVTQLYHAPWIDAIRATTVGGLILGFGFLWSDIVAYGVGTLIGALLDKYLFRSAKTKDRHL